MGIVKIMNNVSYINSSFQPLTKSSFLSDIYLSRNVRVKFSFRACSDPEPDGSQEKEQLE